MTNEQSQQSAWRAKEENWGNDDTCLFSSKRNESIKKNAKSSDDFDYENAFVSSGNEPKTSIFPRRKVEDALMSFFFPKNNPMRQNVPFFPFYSRLFDRNRIEFWGDWRKQKFYQCKIKAHFLPKPSGCCSKRLFRRWNKFTIEWDNNLLFMHARLLIYPRALLRLHTNRRKKRRDGRERKANEYEDGDV